MTDDYANWSARGRAPADDEKQLREELAAEQPARRNAALALVDEAESGLAEETVHALIACVRESEDADTRQFAVEALGVASTGVSGIVAGLADGEEWVRAEAVVAYSRARPDGTDRLESVLREDDSGWVRRNALIAMAKTGVADDDLLIDRIKNDPHPAVREYGAQFLRTSDDTERAVRVLAAVLAREQNAFTRLKAAESLGEFGTERAQEAIERFGLSDRSDDVRRTAKQALARARGVKAEALDIEDITSPGSGPDRPEDRTPAQRGEGRPVGHRESDATGPAAQGRNVRPEQVPRRDPER